MGVSAGTTGNFEMENSKQTGQGVSEETERRTLKRKTDAVRSELQLANRTLVEVRKTQLQQLLENEKKQFESELKSMGLMYYKEHL